MQIFNKTHSVVSAMSSTLAHICIVSFHPLKNYIVFLVGLIFFFSLKLSFKTGGMLR